MHAYPHASKTIRNGDSTLWAIQKSKKFERRGNRDWATLFSFCKTVQ
jgi:hypothetical protein